MSSFFALLARAVWPASPHARAAVITCVWGAASVVTTLWRNASAPPPPHDRPLVAASGGYVSSNTCSACHPGNHASWYASFHRTMTQPATPANFLPQLDGVELSLAGTAYRVERQGEAFYVRQRAADAPAADFGPPREIVLLTGSHHLQNFWLATGEGRGLEPFPFGWVVAEKMWAPLGDTFLSPPELKSERASGSWNNGCLHCHTTAGAARGLRDGTFDSRVAEFGISCESCHGEGREHIDRHSNPLQRYAAHFSSEPDPTIANPARMSGPASALACGQCHSVWAFASAEAESLVNRSGTQFRPGQAVLGDRFVAQPTTDDHAAEKQKIREGNPHFFEDSYWPDGMVRITGREYNGVELSPCFKGGNFSCISCHEMHPDKTDPVTLKSWAVSQMRSDAKSDTACIQCHPKIAADIPAHTRHPVASAGSRCYDCHMPHSSFGLLRAVRSHQVSSPNINESVRHGRPNACNLCHLDQPLAWTAEKLGDWYGHAVPALASEDRDIAAGAKWLLKGDAGQRALIAWAMGWAPAQQASGRDWLPPYLAITLNDPYAAVRYAAWKSLQTLPGFEDFSFIYTADDDTTFAAANTAYLRSVELRSAQPPSAPPPAATLLDAAGHFAPGPYQRLLDERDNRRIYLVE